ncbi:hypothetical protein Q5O14_07715 [Eubacteriaceae bacterium ES2]|nr:hypothetical protein Q5O14_07715 [Eubacteriaceae bacterium ES2]
MERIMCFSESNILESDVNRIIEKIKEVLKEELPEEKQTGEIIEYILHHALLKITQKKRKWEWNVQL